MFDQFHPRSHFRPLLTDTLPYEVPVIFSNTKLYRNLSAKVQDADISAAMAKIRPNITYFTIPYNYHIAKSERSRTALSIVHPLHQLRFCDFYHNYQSTIVASCSRSSFSLRRPAGISKKYVESIKLSEGDAIFKSGTVDEEDLPAPKVGSYFSYATYSLVGNFIDSREYIRLEKRFRLMRSMDVARCFFNIYTHSVSWAVKNKPLSKEAANSYSFESAFDTLMQHANYNETNGIVVGPEISRVFAECIFQDIDQRLKLDLDSRGLTENWDYAVRRYVDDYFIFANNESSLQFIETSLRRHLEDFKLFPNEAKLKTYSRPFVSNITMTRRALRGQFKSLSNLFRNLDTATANDLSWLAREVRSDIEDIRAIITNHGADFQNVSGWMLGTIRKTMWRLNKRVDAWNQPDRADGFADLLVSLLDLTFYICALDLRVRSTYSLCQILVSTFKTIPRLSDRNADVLRHVVSDELIGLVRRKNHDPNADAPDDIELFNLLICGAHFVGSEFLASQPVQYALRTLASMKVTYFRFVSVKFCMLKALNVFGSDVVALNENVRRVILSSKGQAFKDAETYLLLCDYLSSPDVEEADKRKVFDTLFSGTITKKAMAYLSEKLGFVDWSGVDVENLLVRKELRPAYE